MGSHACCRLHTARWHTHCGPHVLPLSCLLLLLVRAHHAALVCAGDKDAPEKQVSIASPALQQLDASLSGALAELLGGGDFEGKAGSASRALRLGSTGSAGPKYVALLGLGKADELAAADDKPGAHPYQAAGAALSKLAKTEKSASAALALLSTPAGQADEAVKRLTAGGRHCCSGPSCMPAACRCLALRERSAYMTLPDAILLCRRAGGLLRVHALQEQGQAQQAGLCVPVGCWGRAWQRGGDCSRLRTRRGQLHDSVRLAHRRGCAWGRGTVARCSNHI